MKTLKQWFCWSGIASFLLGVVMTVALQAADMRTVAVISVADLDTAVKTLKSVTTQAGFPDAMAEAEMMLPALQGYDLKQPVGIVILADDESFSGYGFLPISNLATMPGLGEMLAFGEKQADGSIMIPLPMGPMPLQVYIKQSGKWAFVSVLELPKTLPTDPAKLLEGMDKQYLLGVKANVANLPKDLCLDALNGIRMMAEFGAPSEEQLENLNAAFDQIETLLVELKAFSFGVSVTAQNDIVIDTSAEAVAGSVMAGDFAAMASFKTNQIGFYQPQDSIVAMLGTGILNAMVKKQYVSQLASFFEGVREGIEDGDLDVDEMAAAKSVIDNVEAMLNSTIESGKIDAGVTWRKNGTLLVGATITDGGKLQQALEKSLVAVPEEFQQYVKLNVETFEGFAVSTIAVPMSLIPDPMGEMPKGLASKTPTLQIAIKDTAIALAFGLDNTVLADLKMAITASKTPANLPETVFALTPGNLIDFAKLFTPSDPDQLEQFEQGMEMLRAFPTDAKITATDLYSGNVNKSKVVVSGKLLPGIGKLVGMGIEAANTARDAARRFSEGYDDYDIDDFDF